jgi:hypothetical protein
MTVVRFELLWTKKQQVEKSVKNGTVVDKEGVPRMDGQTIFALFIIWGAGCMVVTVLLKTRILSSWNCQKHPWLTSIAVSIWPVTIPLYVLLQVVQRLAAKKGRA